ncbi:N-acetylmuramoyl-L-alanine amidase CwlD [Desnuesiella massiliensis]|uniref:N-acetylmuramoyl-L-alanine amidase CwlD n=1 Tax=Desnuesiella massiliensis TaxID=1650662 RepID=UPI0006E362F7|nr:N-acetylmuramoyl-L-alanine amidase CwlD [Desnuesiella massiliensis]
MRKKCRIILFTLLSILFFSPHMSFAKTIENTKDKIILIDPGHGGMDGGAVSKNGTLEKDISLLISLKVKGSLEKAGYKVFMTRDEDKGLYENKGTVRNKKNQDLTNRCKMKKETNCDMFISIHLNMFPQSKYSGAQVWYSREEESKTLARILQKNMIEDLDPQNNRVEKPALDQYKILRDGYDKPGVIIECGFLSNEQEEAKLKTEEYQQKIAETITKSVKEYYGR